MIEIESLTLRYRGAPEATLNDVNLKVASGELILMTGPTGCGKSTLLNCINAVLLHESSSTRIEGTIRLDGRDIRHCKLSEICRLTGTVFQNPDSQICTATPEMEIAFGLENLSFDRETMFQRIEEALAIVGLEGSRHRPTSTLSGGQKQRLMIACALATRPKVLLLDEPISQLDSAGAQEILKVIGLLKEKFHMAVILVEHRLEETIAMADRVVLLEEGRILADRSRAETLNNLQPLRRLGLNLPQLPELFEQLGRSERPVQAEEAPLLPLQNDSACVKETPNRPMLGRIEQLQFAYNRREEPILQELNLTLHRGDRIALMGANGSGKTTLLHLLAGLLKPTGGRIIWKSCSSSVDASSPAIDSSSSSISEDMVGSKNQGRSTKDRFGSLIMRNRTTKPQTSQPSIGLVMQSADLMLFSESVRAEVAFAPFHAGLPQAERDALVDEVLVQTELEDLAEQAPFALSRGQRLRTAVASVLSMRPSILLLDEPTTGQDRRQIERMMQAMATEFNLVVFATHDMETAARHANRVVLLEGGRVLAEGDPLDVLFDEMALRKASIRASNIQSYGERLGVRVLRVDSLLSLVQE